jgi:ELWxxDGT repeat protein/cysteine-rich repeat protein
VPRRLFHAFVLALASVLLPAIAAAVPVLVRDVRVGAEGGLERRDRMAFGAAGATLWFAADDGDTGYEPWRSDGTPSGTVRVADLGPGTDGSAPYGFTAFGDEVFFAASGPVAGEDTGTELWRSDGTPAGTHIVRDIAGAALSSYPLELTPLGDHLYFTAGEIEGGRELWRTDGTAAGTERVVDLEAGPDGSEPSDLVVMGGILYFTALVGGERELWRTNGTALGTHVVRDLNGTSSSFPAALTVAGATLFFRATGAQGAELWKTDGTEPGTQQVKDIQPGNPGSEPDLLTAAGDTLCFVADDGASGPEPWRSDGTDAGTQPLRDIGEESAGSFPSHLTAVGSRLFFVAFHLDTGRELWTSDGTTTGTVRLTDLGPGTTNGIDELGELVASNGLLYFRGVDPARGPALWQSDGSVAGTVPVADLVASAPAGAPVGVPGAGGSGGDDDGPTFLTDVAGTLFFRAQDAASGLEPWVLTACGDGVVSAAEECDDGNQQTGDCCTATCRFEPAGLRCGDDGVACGELACDGEGACEELPLGGPCDDGAVCTADDVCGEGVCRGSVAGFHGVRCLLFELAAGELCDTALPAKLGRLVRRRAGKAIRFVDRVERKLGRSAPASRMVRLLERAETAVGTIAVEAADAARAPKERDRIPVECADRLMAGVSTVQSAIPTLVPVGGL